MPGTADVLQNMANSGLRIAFLIALIVTIIEVARKVVRLILDYKLWVVIKPKPAN